MRVVIWQSLPFLLLSPYPGTSGYGGPGLASYSYIGSQSMVDVWMDGRQLMRTAAEAGEWMSSCHTDDRMELVIETRIAATDLQWTNERKNIESAIECNYDRM